MEGECDEEGCRVDGDAGDAEEGPHLMDKEGGEDVECEDGEKDLWKCEAEEEGCRCIIIVVV